MTLKRAAYSLVNCIRESLFVPHGEQIVSLLSIANFTDVKRSCRSLLWESLKPVILGTIGGKNVESFHARVTHAIVNMVLRMVNVFLSVAVFN